MSQFFPLGTPTTASTALISSLAFTATYAVNVNVLTASYGPYTLIRNHF